MKEKFYIIPIFIPDLGCPNQCVFCNQKRITGQQEIPSPGQVNKIIKDYLKTIPGTSDARIEIAFYGGSFTAIPVKDQKVFLQEAWKYVQKGIVSGIRISTRPDKISEEILSTLMAYGVTTIELGVQSTDQEVLRLARRGHSVEDVVKSSALIRLWGFFLGIQIMLGLPGDNQEKALETCNRVIGLEPDFVRIYPVLVLKDTELEEMYIKGEYNPWTVEQVVETAKVMLNRFQRAGIDVIRIGLQSTEEISPGGDIVAGPYHPAIGELVYSALILEAVQKLLKKAGITPGEARSVDLSVSPKDESKIRGHKSQNFQKLQSRYGFSNINLKTNGEIKPGSIRITGIDGRPVCYNFDQEDLIL